MINATLHDPLSNKVPNHLKCEATYKISLNFISDKTWKQYHKNALPHR